MKKLLTLLWVLICIPFRVIFNDKPSVGFMAIIKMGQIVAEARGKIAGMVFSRNSSGMYIRQKVSGINPQTGPQMFERALMTTVSQAWRGITAAQRLAWNSVASTWVRINVFGDNVPLTGFGLYCRLNRNLQVIDQALIASPPAHSAVIGVDSTSLVADTTLGTLTLTFTPAIPATQYLILYATKPVSAGVSFVKSEYRYITILNPANISPFEFAAQYILVHGELPGVTERVFVKIKPLITATGQDGVPMEASDIAV